MPKKYLPAERTVRKARKQARLEAAAEQQQEQDSRRLALAARMKDLLAEQAALASESASKKNCARRKAVRRASPEQQADTVEYTVVHGSASCEQLDEDVIDLHSFLEQGINPKIDEAFKAQEAAQTAMQDMHDNLVDSAVKFSVAQSCYNAITTPPFHVLPELPALRAPTVPPEGTSEPGAATAASLFSSSKKRGTARMQCTPSSSDDDDAIFPTSSSSGDDGSPQPAHHRARDSEGFLLDILERREEEEEDERVANNSYHDERVVRIVEAGYMLREAISALAATKERGLESTQRACDHLRVTSNTPIAAVSKAVKDCQDQLKQQQQQQKLASAITKKTEDFGPALSDYVSANPGAETAASMAKAHHDACTFGHLSCSSKAATNLKQQLQKHRELQACKWLGAICLAVCEEVGGLGFRV
jgi:hypothetical protein